MKDNAKNTPAKLFVVPKNDREAVATIKILEEAGANFVVTGQQWGATWDEVKTEWSYSPGLEPEVKETIQKFRDENPDGIVYAFELIGCPDWVEIIDHHGPLAGRLPSIIQVCRALGVTYTQDDAFTGAQDAAGPNGLLAIGATLDQISEFYGLGPANGRSLKEILLEVEDPAEFDEGVLEEADWAVAEMERMGDMIVVRPSHSKTIPIMTRLIEEQDKQNVLILSGDGEINYYGTGDTVRDLLEEFGEKAGWTGSGGAGLYEPEEGVEEFWTQYGGSVPNSAFFCAGGLDHQEVLDFLKAKFA